MLQCCQYFFCRILTFSEIMGNYREIWGYDWENLKYDDWLALIGLQLLIEPWKLYPCWLNDWLNGIGVIVCRDLPIENTRRLMVRTFVHYKLQNIATFIYLANAHTSCLQYIHIIFGSFPTIKIYQLSVNYRSVQLSQLETYQTWPSPRRGQARLQLHPPCRGHAGKQLKCARKMRI